MELLLKNRTVIDINPVLKAWRSAHSGGDLDRLRQLLDTYIGNQGKNGADDIVSRMKFVAKTFLISPYVFTPGANNQEFKILQGDIIQSSLVETPFPLYAYENNAAPYFIVKPNSCLVQRLKQVDLTRIHPIEQPVSSNIQFIMKTALRFENRRWLFIPPIDGQSNEVIGNYINFDEVSVINKADLLSATRIHSLTEFGWHVFSQYLADWYSKPSQDDLKIRKPGSTKVTLEK